MRGFIVLAIVLVGCETAKQIVEVEVTTPKQNFNMPVVGYGTPVGKVNFFVERYLPFVDPPSDFLEIRGIQSIWYDSSGSDIDYRIWFSIQGEVDTNQTGYYASLECTADSLTCVLYEQLLSSFGYTIKQPDTTFRKVLIQGRTTAGVKNYNEYSLTGDAVALMDSAIRNGGFFLLIQVSMNDPNFTDTLYIYDFYQRVRVGLR